MCLKRCEDYSRHRNPAFSPGAIRTSFCNFQYHGRGEVYDSNYFCATKQHAGNWRQCDSSVSESNCPRGGTHRTAQADQQHTVAGTGNGHGCNPRRAACDDSSAPPRRLQLVLAQRKRSDPQSSPGPAAAPNGSAGKPANLSPAASSRFQLRRRSGRKRRA